MNQISWGSAALADVIGGRAIVQAEMSAYPTALPYAQDVTNETVYATVPDTYRHTLRLEHHGIDHTFYAFQIAGRRVTVFYDPADSYKPVLRVGGEEIAAGGAADTRAPELRTGGRVPVRRKRRRRPPCPSGIPPASGGD